MSQPKDCSIVLKYYEREIDLVFNNHRKKIEQINKDSSEDYFSQLQDQEIPNIITESDPVMISKKDVNRRVEVLKKMNQ